MGDEARLIISAGLITTAGALTVASFHIINDPIVMKKLSEELSTVNSIENADWHTLEKLPYLNGCVHEGIRLSHGVVMRSPRLAPDIELRYGDWVIPRNTPVSMTSIGILMNEEIYPEPRAFVPERWIENPELDRYFVPFGKGSRQCLGMKYVDSLSRSGRC